MSQQTWVTAAKLVGELIKRTVEGGVRASQTSNRKRGRGREDTCAPCLGEKDENQEPKETVSGVPKCKAKEARPG